MKVTATFLSLLQYKNQDLKDILRPVWSTPAPLTSLGLVFLAADNVEEAGALGAERQKCHLKHSRHNGYTQQNWPQVLNPQ